MAAIRGTLMEDKIPDSTNSGALIYPLPSPAIGPLCRLLGLFRLYYRLREGEVGPEQVTMDEAEAAEAGFCRLRLSSWVATFTPEVMRYEN